MTDVALSATRIFNLRGATQLRISIRIGNADPGGTTVYHDGVFLQEVAGDLLDFPVPARPGPLENTILTTVTSVRDTNPQTNRTVIHYEARGGDAILREDFEIDVPDHGGRAMYTITLAVVS
jgi:hypothetical protein